MKPAKDAPLKRPIDEDPSPKAALQKNEQSPIIGLPHSLSGESQTVSSLSVRQQPVTSPPPTPRTTSKNHTTPVQNHLLLHPSTYTYDTTGK
jgi:hypothetical protein